MMGFDREIIRQRADRRLNNDGLPVEQRGWANAGELTLYGMHVQPLSSRETFQNDARQVVSQWVVLNAPGTGDIDVQVGDRLVIDGRITDVIAEPERWPSPMGGIDHVEVAVQITPPGAGAGGNTSEGQIAAAEGQAATGQGWVPR